jgi:hypothetical protein
MRVRLSPEAPERKSRFFANYQKEEKEMETFHFFGFSCCRRIITTEKFVEIILETYGVKNFDAIIEQIENVGINVKCPFCRSICWINPPPQNFMEKIRSFINIIH